MVGNKLNLNLPVEPLLNGSFGSSLSSNVDVDNNGYNGEKEIKYNVFVWINNLSSATLTNGNLNYGCGQESCVYNVVLVHGLYLWNV